MKKASMQDIANALGISKNSVSQALRNKAGVSQQTRLLVQKKAEELGYQYQKNDENMDRPKFLLLATEFAFSQTSFFGEITKSIETESLKAGFQIDTHTLTENDISSMTIPPFIKEYDGIIILSHSDNSYIGEIISTKIPIILVDHHDPSLLADAILSKNTDGTFQAISLLIENNLQRIGFIGDINFSPSYLERYRGYHRTLAEYGIPYDDSIEITQIEETQGTLFNKLKNIEEMPDAWFCVNSGLAFMLNSYLQSAGYTIPDDISIICFDDTEFTRMAIPPITNVATDLHYMGQLAVRSLINRITHVDEPFVHQQIVPQLNIRESVRFTEKMKTIKREGP
ncbi:LacI family DNA-binding transcriptional regulator [Enterococcus sp. BWB1-3]|uniref:LacI family DNA-binding transcriptional regulator n=1 Tax=unclassified Enterococcus TaxID=2608891 RepID=UPI0019207AD2|nr:MULTISPECIES: LacI family DNA-binding transcriptional regulator [unclassified Enterococcus]MBL1229497.1 LacI family DNA-binding transcriptional regulator [Enterococcus sp. BWB1-3]MCB5952671.1 LacI family DNA-binding transcriptional regulator [Enterococcus sp. BWT-B8]